MWGRETIGCLGVRSEFGGFTLSTMRNIEGFEQRNYMISYILKDYSGDYVKNKMKRTKKQRDELGGLYNSVTVRITCKYEDANIWIRKVAGSRVRSHRMWNVSKKKSKMLPGFLTRRMELTLAQVGSLETEQV